MQTQKLATAIMAGVVGIAIGVVGALQFAKLVAGKAHDQKSVQDCRGLGTCNVDIYVDTCDPANPNPAQCEVFANKEFTLVNSSNTRIDFHVKTQRFDFEPSDGIQFTAANSGNLYLPCTPQGPMFRCENKIPAGTPPTAYKYTIHIKNLPKVDPWVVNY